MTRQWMMTLAAGCLAVSVGLAAQDAAPAASPGKAGIVGLWSLDKDLSDWPDDGRGPDGGGRPMGGPPGGGMGGRGGMGGGMPGGMGGFGGRGGDRDENRRSGRIMQDLVKPPDGFTIVKDGAVVIFTTNDGRSVKLMTDGKEQERLSGDGMIKSKASWNGDQLTVEERIQDGPKVFRTYLSSSDARQLIIITRIEGGGMAGSPVVHHVYTRKG